MILPVQIYTFPMILLVQIYTFPTKYASENYTFPIIEAFFTANISHINLSRLHLEGR